MNETVAANGGAAAALLASPRDALEAMLAQQMAAVHEAALRAMERAAECADHPQIEALYLRAAARLMNLFVRQTEALDRRHAAAEKRADEQAREAHFLEKAQREEEERAFVLRIRPEKPRRRPERKNPRGNGTRHAPNGTGAPP